MKINKIDSSTRTNPITIKAKTQPWVQPDHTPQPTGPEDTVKTSATPAPQVAAPASETPAAQPQPASQTAKPDGTASQQPLDPKYEAMAKKESALRTRERELQAREVALDTKVQEAVQKAVSDLRAQYKSNALDMLEEDGVTYDHIVEQAVNRPDPALRQLNKKIDTIQSTQAKLAEQAKQAQDQTRQNAIKQLRGNVERLVESKADFETIKTTGSIDDVVDKIVSHFDATGELMTEEEAATQVENELFEEAMKIANMGKVKAKLQPTLAQAVSQQPAQQQQATTLTNSMNSSKPLSPRERAIRAFRGDKT